MRAANHQTFKRLYLTETREERNERERDDHIECLYKMDLAIRRFILDDEQWSRKGIRDRDMWDALALCIHQCQEKLKEVDCYSDGELYAVVRDCEGELRRAATFSKFTYLPAEEYEFLICVLQGSSMTQRTARDMLDSLEGGRMVFPKALNAYEEIRLRGSLWNCISVTVPSPKGGIQMAMHKHGAVGASMVGIDWKVYFRKGNEEQAVLLKCMA